MNIKTLSVLFPFAILIYIIDPVTAIRCFKCSVGPDPRLNKTLLCSKFDESSNFVVDCPYSTMCVKTVLRSVLDGKVVETVLRDCAKQKYTEQVARNGNWEKEVTIEEPYQETCETLKENAVTGKSKLYCHCRGSLCNSAPKDLLPSYHTDLMGVILVYNAMKYFRNLD